MNTLKFICLFGLLVASVAAKKCFSPNDCDETECCIARGLFRAGECEPFAKDGEECSEIDVRSPLTAKYIEHCPCEVGLYCEPQEAKEDDSLWKKILKNFRCTAQRRDTVRPTRRPKPTIATTAAE